jgi:sulfur-oxidizing protein SoxA
MDRRQWLFRIRLGYDRCRVSVRVQRRLTFSTLLTSVFLVACPAIATEIAVADRHSDYEFMSRETQAMQDDDAANPGMLWVLEGETLWNTKAGEANKSCADCHNDARVSMKGVASSYPSFSNKRKEPVDLEVRVNICRTDQQNATPLAFESKELLALVAYVARQSHGMPIKSDTDARLKPYIEAGQKIFYAAQGQLNLSCAQCHDDNWGKQLAGNKVPQGHPTGYPLYRLEWQGLGSLQRRLRACLSGMRAQSYEYGSIELIELELYLMRRARGMMMDTPAVRP